MKRFFLFCVITLMCLISVVSMAQTKNKNAGVKGLNNLVIAFNHKTDANGYYSLLDCPREHSNLQVKVTPSDGDYDVNIYMLGKLLNSFKCSATGTDVRFVDANFDGYYDIFVGPASSRNYSQLYLWDPQKMNYYHAQSTDDLNGVFLLNPSKKQWVSRGSSSYCSMYYTIFSWKNGKEIDHETLVEITDPLAYPEYGVKKRYTIFSGDGSDTKTARKKLDTNQKSKLPKEWRKIFDSYDRLVK